MLPTLAKSKSFQLSIHSMGVINLLLINEKNRWINNWRLNEHNYLMNFCFVEIRTAKFNYYKHKHVVFNYWFIFDYFNCSQWPRFIYVPSHFVYNDWWKQKDEPFFFTRGEWKKLANERTNEKKIRIKWNR